MHLLKHKTEKPKPLVPVISRWKVPYHRHMRGRRYKDGADIGPCGPPKPVPDVRDGENLRREQRRAALLPKPEEGEPFNLDRYRPMRGRVLLKRPPQITHEKGVELPEKQYRSESWFFVIKVGDGVTVCQPGDRVMFDKRGLPRPVRLGGAFHLGRAKGVVAIVEG